MSSAGAYFSQVSLCGLCDLCDAVAGDSLQGPTFAANKLPTLSLSLSPCSLLAHLCATSLGHILAARSGCSSSRAFRPLVSSGFGRARPNCAQVGADTGALNRARAASALITAHLCRQQTNSKLESVRSGIKSAIISMSRARSNQRTHTLPLFARACVATMASSLARSTTSLAASFARLRRLRLT